MKKRLLTAALITALSASSVLHAATETPGSRFLDEDKADNRPNIEKILTSVGGIHYFSIGRIKTNTTLVFKLKETGELIHFSVEDVHKDLDKELRIVCSKHADSVAPIQTAVAFLNAPEKLAVIFWMLQAFDPGFKELEDKVKLGSALAVLGFSIEQINTSLKAGITKGTLPEIKREIIDAFNTYMPFHDEGLKTLPHLLSSTKFQELVNIVNQSESESGAGAGAGFAAPID